MPALIESVSHGVAAALTEIRLLGRTLNQRANDVLAYFEPLRGIALDLRNLTNYIARSLLETGGSDHN